MLRKRPFAFPLDKQLRVICDTDANNEADDQYCIAHMLMTPRFDVKALIAEHYGTDKSPCSEQKNYEKIHRIVSLMELDRETLILHGAPSKLPDISTPVKSEGARFIIEEAMKDDSRPLFVCCIGAITNVASALLLEPRIADRITVIWIGGDTYPNGGFEYNLHNDIHAAKEHARMMEDTSTPLGSRFLTMSHAAAATSFAGELWCLWDSPAVGLMLNHTVGHFHMSEAPCGVNEDYTYNYSETSSRRIRIYDDIDNHFILSDFFEKLRYYFG